MMSSFKRSSSNGTDVHATIISSFGSASSGVGLARARSSTRKALDDELGIPAVPAGVEHGDLDRLPQLSRQQAGDAAAIVLDLRQDDETSSEQRQRKRRETDDDDGPENADQCEGDRA
jgi:hypothetical protein